MSRNEGGEEGEILIWNTIVPNKTCPPDYHSHGNCDWLKKDK